MNSTTRRSFLTTSLVIPLWIVALPKSLQAQERGQAGVRVVRDSIRERDGAWRLLMRVRLSDRPEEPEVTLRFQFRQTIDFQPGDEKGKTRKVPVDPPLVIVKEQTVDMRNVHGEVGFSTRAELSLTRTGGFRAGVWMLRVEGPNGVVGTPVRLTLEGENPGEADAGS